VTAPTPAGAETPTPAPAGRQPLTDAECAALADVLAFEAWSRVPTSDLRLLVSARRILRASGLCP
jgi:hypothetical protein